MIWNDNEVKSFFRGGYDSNALISSSATQVGGTPFYNEPVASTVPGVYKSNVGTSKKLMSEILRTPECLGIFNRIIKDIFHDFRFKSVESSTGKAGRKKSGQAKTMKADEFAKKNMLMCELEKCGWDWLVTGDFYLWKGTPQKDPESVSQLVKKTLDNYNQKGFEVKTNSVIFPSGDEVKISEFYDEDSRNASILHVASTTMEPIFDILRVKAFKQAVGSAQLVDSTGTRELEVQTGPGGLIERIWPAEDIIHGKYIDIDGKVWGFSPTQALMPIISTLQMIKDHHGHFFDNQGIPAKAFIFKKVHPKHSSVVALEKVLAMAKKQANKQRNLILTSEVEVMDLNKFDKDMEFRQLAIYYTGLIALSFNMPIDVIQSIVVEEKPKDSDIGDTAYWRSISKAQRYWADLLNGQYFNETLEVDIEFINPFEQDKIRKAQKEAQMWAVAGTMLSMGASSEYVRDFLEIPDKYDFELEKPENPMEQEQGKSPDNETNPGMRKQKKKEQENQQEKKGMKNEGF